jgi:hypothetical protein
MTHDELRWVHPHDLDAYPFPKTGMRVIEAMRNYERMQGKVS